MRYLSLIALTLALAGTADASMPEVTEDEAKKQTMPAPGGEADGGSTTKSQSDDGKSNKKPCVIL